MHEIICLEGNGSRPSHQGNGWKVGGVMYTLNSTEVHAICLEHHPNDSRIKIKEDGICQTLNQRMGTGGGNVPIILIAVNIRIEGNSEEDSNDNKILHSKS